MTDRPRTAAGEETGGLEIGLPEMFSFPAMMPFI